MSCPRIGTLLFCVYVCMYVYACVCVHMHELPEGWHALVLCVYVCVRMCICLCVDMYIHTVA